MFLIDDLLAAPLSGLLFVFREIGRAVEAERDAEERRLMAELGELHRKVEAGRISEAEFEAQEGQLLARLGRLRGEDGGDAPA